MTLVKVAVVIEKTAIDGVKNCENATAAGDADVRAVEGVEHDQEDQREHEREERSPWVAEDDPQPALEPQPAEGEVGAAAHARPPSVNSR